LAGEYSVALKEAVAFLHSSDLAHAESRPIADLWLAAAWLYWRQESLFDSLLAFGRALIARPALMGRPLKRLVERLAV